MNYAILWSRVYFSVVLTQICIIFILGMCVCVKSLQLCPTICDSMNFPRLLCPWDSLGKTTGLGCHFLLQRIFHDPGIEPTSLVSPALAGGFFTTSTIWEANKYWYIDIHIDTYTLISNNQWHTNEHLLWGIFLWNQLGQIHLPKALELT